MMTLQKNCQKSHKTIMVRISDVTKAGIVTRAEDG
jgi:hypothetical protein